MALMLMIMKVRLFNPDDKRYPGNTDFTSSSGYHMLSGSHSCSGATDMAQLVAEKPTLRDYLHEQIIFTFRDAAQCLVAADLGEQIDESGYFAGSLEETARRLDVGLPLVRQVFSRLQNFEQAGIFVRDLAECLALQLTRRGRLTAPMEILLKNLPILARKDFDTLARLCKTSQNDIMYMLKEIQFLDPKPAAIWSTAVASAIVPDAFVTENRDSTFRVELNNAVLPSLVVNCSYSAEICADVAERQFLSNCQHHANWLLRALDQRAKTLLKVIGEIVRQQQPFLREGIVALRPLSQAKVADAVRLHESTISRVIANKYLATPRGMFELRSFFSAGLGSGEEVDCPSSDAVRFHIRHMIATETADDILSDDAIMERLRAKGIDIARRTVAKYRESMHIASSVIRRRARRHEKITT